MKEINKSKWVKTPEKTLELLSDKEWHKVSEISKEAFSQGNGVKKALKSMDRIGLVEFKEDKKEAKIDEIGLEILELPQPEM